MLVRMSNNTLKKMKDDGIGFFIGDLFFGISYYLLSLDLMRGQTVVTIPGQKIVKLVKLIQAFLTNRRHFETHLLGEVVVRIEPTCIKIGTTSEKPIQLTFKETRSCFIFVESKMEWIFQDLIRSDLVFINNFIVLLSQSKIASISDINSTFQDYNSYSSEILEIVLESCQFSQDEHLKIEAFHLVAKNLDRITFLIFAIRANAMKIEVA